MTATTTPVVLAVDDDEKLLETYEIWLAADYDLRTADSGERALEKLDADVDVVLLDRLLPDLAGEALLQEIRDRDIECQTAMVTAVEPDFAIAEMPFDAYVSKAIDGATIKETVERLAARAQHDALLQEHYAVAEKLATLEKQKTETELAASSAYQKLLDRFGELESVRSDRAAALDRDDIVSEIGRAERVAERTDENPGGTEDRV